MNVAIASRNAKILELNPIASPMISTATPNQRPSQNHGCILSGNESLIRLSTASPLSVSLLVAELKLLQLLGSWRVESGGIDDGLKRVVREWSSLVVFVVWLLGV